MASKILGGKDQPSFYAFGAAHLAGKYGVLPLLKRAGIQVKPVKM